MLRSSLVLFLHFGLERNGVISWQKNQKARQQRRKAQHGENRSPQSARKNSRRSASAAWCRTVSCTWLRRSTTRSEEHTSELQSQSNLVCRLLLEKKKKQRM